MQKLMVLKKTIQNSCWFRAKDKDKTGPNFDVLNLSRNSRLCSHIIKARKRSSFHCGMSGDPERRKSTKSWRSASSASLHILFCGNQLAPFGMLFSFVIGLGLFVFCYFLFLHIGVFKRFWLRT